MATRPPGTPARTKKSATAAPLPPQQSRDDEQASSNPTRDTPAEQSPAAEVQIKQVRLEQREIPSFSESRELRIAEAAYWRAERRGFAPGNELDDWLEAEREIDEEDVRVRGANRNQS